MPFSYRKSFNKRHLRARIKRLESATTAISREKEKNKTSEDKKFSLLEDLLDRKIGFPVILNIYFFMLI
jgi:hypothetical protein